MKSYFISRKQVNNSDIYSNIIVSIYNFEDFDDIPNIDEIDEIDDIDDIDNINNLDDNLYKKSVNNRSIEHTEIKVFTEIDMEDNMHEYIQLLFDDNNSFAKQKD